MAPGARKNGAKHGGKRSKRKGNHQHDRYSRIGMDDSMSAFPAAEESEEGALLEHDTTATAHTLGESVGQPDHSDDDIALPSTIQASGHSGGSTATAPTPAAGSSSGPSAAASGVVASGTADDEYAATMDHIATHLQGRPSGEAERVKRERERDKKKKRKSRSARRNAEAVAAIATATEGASNAGAAGSSSTAAEATPPAAAAAAAAAADDDNTPAPPSSKHVPVNPISHQFLVQNPNGELCVAVDAYKPRVVQEEAPAGVAEERAPHPVFHPYDTQVLNDMDEMNGALTYETLLHLRRLRSFIFLLGMDFFYLLLLLVMRLAGRQPQHAQYEHIMSLIFNLILDTIGFSGAYRQNINMLTSFIVCGGVFVAFEGLVQTFSPMIIVRLVIIVLAMQVRQGLIVIRERQHAVLELLQVAENGRRARQRRQRRAEQMV
eukprot:TRINITY_DN2012_c0_g1_i1.p1 TRINITY_DN2012_c0_g1~~TRINITY_DN2012_c0_g1_i1.p1  ORF type:complete len:436 (-),score=69.32 TRINITY_DN2012_c0_g1_i1:118-1425(-)